MSEGKEDVFLKDFSERLEKKEKVIEIDREVRNSVEMDCQRKINKFAIDMSNWREKSLSSTNFAF
jgi:hypothetical protein